MSCRLSPSILLLLVALVVDWAPGVAQAVSTQGRLVALTFDDIPMTGAACTADKARIVTTRLTTTLRNHNLPSAVLASPGRACVTTEMFSESARKWMEVGATIGNHTATHPDINSTGMAAYLADIDRAQALIDQVPGNEVRWFRAPYLHMGDDTRKKEALQEHLEVNGYKVAPVTADNQEWVYAAVYDDARRRGDAAFANRVTEAYIDHLEEVMAFYERLSVVVFGREIPQVLLLHANLLNADQLERVLAMLRGRGYGFVSLEQAVSDAAYSREDTYVGPRGLSWLQRWALEDGKSFPSEPREAPWVAEAYRRMSRVSP